MLIAKRILKEIISIEIDTNISRKKQNSHNNFLTYVVYYPDFSIKEPYTYIEIMKCDGLGISLLEENGLNYSDPTDHEEIPK